ncbi:MAG TPA: hypothetical protein VK752_05265 [Bryobacteraceae bacterium]|jgi:hypothetical protein|nr:hypothetical protein [Bryobacteraceae bacterium]
MARRSKAEPPQLDLSATELDRLGTRVLTDYRNALADHNHRMVRWAEYERRWQGTPDVPQAGQESESNLPVPYIRWNVLGQTSKDADALFGDDAEIVAEPVGASDYKRVKKVGLYMTWRVFKSMKITKRLLEFVGRRVKYGRAFAYCPWLRRTYKVGKKEVVDYEGPDFIPLWPDDLIVPAEEVETIHGFSFVIRKYRATPDDFLAGVEKQIYIKDVVDEHWDQIVNPTRRQREPQGDETKLEADQAQAVPMEAPLSAMPSLLVLEWYGKWRMLLDPEDDGDENDLTKREKMQSDLVVRYVVDLSLPVGCQDLAKLYPEMSYRRPFVEGAFINDGSYWCAGLPKMLIDIEDELRQNYNLGTSAGEKAAGPLIVAPPGESPDLDKEQVEISPNMLIRCANPDRVRVIQLASNLEFFEKREQALLAYGERLGALTDNTLGRQNDRPNQPRTLGQAQMIAAESSVRQALVTLALRDDMSAMLNHFWILEYMFSPKQTFFRVTEDDAGGLFPVNDGGSMLEKQDRDGRYDFSLTFATNVYSREADKEKVLARYQLDLQNPLIMGNPSALWHVTRDAHEALGDPEFEQLVPEPPNDDLPINPKEEFSMLLHGDDVHVNPMDNDELHLLRHMKDLQSLEKEGQQHTDTYKKLGAHYIQQMDQLQQKKVVQAVVEQIGQRIAASQQAKGLQPGGAPGGGTPVLPASGGMPPPLPMAEPPGGSLGQ